MTRWASSTASSGQWRLQERAGARRWGSQHAAWRWEDLKLALLRLYEGTALRFQQLLRTPLLLTHSRWLSSHIAQQKVSSKGPCTHSIPPLHPHNAHITTQVEIAGLHVDYSTLIFQQKVALKGPAPRGSTSITLTAQDLGAFTQHPLFLRAAATAVQVRLLVVLGLEYLPQLPFACCLVPEVCTPHPIFACPPTHNMHRATALISIPRG